VWLFAVIIAAIVVVLCGVVVVIARRTQWVTEYYSREETQDTEITFPTTEADAIGHQFSNPLADETLCGSEQSDFQSDPGETGSVTMI
jgi:hypothetical protein